MNSAFSSYSPKVKPLNYDACANRLGIEKVTVTFSQPASLGVGFAWGLRHSDLDPTGSDDYVHPFTSYEAEQYQEHQAYAGSYLSTGIVADLSQESSLVALSFSAGHYFSTIVTPTLPHEKAMLSIAFIGGTYIN